MKFINFVYFCTMRGKVIQLGGNVICNQVNSGIFRYMLLTKQDFSEIVLKNGKVCSNFCCHCCFAKTGNACHSNHTIAICSALTVDKIKSLYNTTKSSKAPKLKCCRKVIIVAL